LISEFTRNQPSLRVDYRSYPFPSVASPVDDVAWGNKILWICARILQWSQLDVRTLDEWHMLRELVNEWEHERPSTFDAFFYHETHQTGERLFPNSWFPSPCHGEYKHCTRLVLAHCYAAHAYQHLRLCRIVLALSDPEANYNLPSTENEARNEVEVVNCLTEMIAVARSNPHAITCLPIAAHATHKFGVALRSQLDQCTVLDFLEEAEVWGWSTESTRNWLRMEWGWPMQDNAEHSSNESP
jgi:hypothetical protein